MAKQEQNETLFHLPSYRGLPAPYCPRISFLLRPGVSDVLRFLVDRAGQGETDELVWAGKMSTRTRCLYFAVAFRAVADSVCEPMPSCGEVFSGIVVHTVSVW